MSCRPLHTWSGTVVWRGPPRPVRYTSAHRRHRERTSTSANSRPVRAVWTRAPETPPPAGSRDRARSASGYSCISCRNRAELLSARIVPVISNKKQRKVGHGSLLTNPTRPTYNKLMESTGPNPIRPVDRPDPSPMSNSETTPCLANRRL